MMKSNSLLVLMLALVQPGHAGAASVTSTPWSEANRTALNVTEKSDLANFISEVSDLGLALHAECSCVTADDIGEFEWVDLRGDGKLELVAILDVNGRKFFNALAVFQRDPAGKVSYQELRGWMIRDLQEVIRDLNGDRRDELVIPTVLFQYNTAATFTWPVVYRLEKGKYVDASRDFPKFYDDEVLPKLDQRLTEYQSMPGQGNHDMAAILIFEREKIVRTLGRNPTAGLQEAYRWMNSDDPLLLLAAAATFKDIGGHQQEANTAGANYGRAICKRHPDMVMCRDIAQP